jgi:hypothetical protein
VTHRRKPPSACHRPERIDWTMGGGHLCTGPCGRPHLHGKPWSWWRCPICPRIEATRALRAAERDRLALYYPEPDRPAPKPESVQRAEYRRRAKERA